MANRFVPASGSAVAATLLIGRVPPLLLAVEIYDRPGLDGYGARALGKRAAGGQLRAMKFDSSYGSAKSWKTSLEALVGTIVSVEYDVSGQSDSSVLIEDVRPTRDEAIVAALDGAGNTYLVDMVVQCRKVA